MSSLADAFLELLELLDRQVKAICVILAGSMAVVIMLQVITRYLPFMHSLPWTEELSRYLMIALAYIGASNGMKRWSNIYVDFFITRLPPKAYRVCMILIQLIVLTFIVYIAYLCIQVYPLVGRRQVSPTMGFSLLIPQSTVIIGTVLMAAQLIGVLIRSLRKGLNDE